jgi:hypothetical protein
MGTTAIRSCLTSIVLFLLDFLPRQPVVYGESGRLYIGRSLLTRVFETCCLVALGLMIGYAVALMISARSWMSVAAGVLLVVMLLLATWLLRAKIVRTTLVVDLAHDSITQGQRLIARTSDVLAVHIGNRRQPAVLVLRDAESAHLHNSVLPHVEGGDGQLVGLTLASYLDVALLRVVNEPAAREEAA